MYQICNNYILQILKYVCLPVAHSLLTSSHPFPPKHDEIL